MKTGVISGVVLSLLLVQGCASLAPQAAATGEQTQVTAAAAAVSTQQASETPPGQTAVNTGLAAEGRVWHLVSMPIGLSYRGASPLEAFLKFDPQTHKVTGHTGCNAFSADYRMDATTLEIHDFKAPHNVCSLGITYESILIQAISASQQWVVRDGQLHLRDGAGEELAIWRGDGEGGR